MRPGSSPLAVTVVLALLGLARIAAAQPVVPAAPAARQAEDHYNRGRALMKAERYQDAAGAFEASQKLDPGWGTLYNLAQCYEHIGKLASAQAMYRELARLDSYPRAASVTAEFDRARRKNASKRADALDKRMPRLRITIAGAAAAPAGLVVTLDGSDAVRLIGSDAPIDLGAHPIHASAPGHQAFDTTATISEEARTVAVVIELPELPEPEPARVDTSPAPTAPADTDTSAKPSVASGGGSGARPAREPGTPSRSSRRTYGLVVAAGGGVLVATGLVFGQLASSKWTEAEDQCPEHICQNAADLNASVVSEARTRATASTVLVIGGAAAIAAGVVLYVTAPRGVRAASTAWRVTPSAGRDRVSLVFDGRF